MLDQIGFDLVDVWVVFKSRNAKRARPDLGEMKSVPKDWHYIIILKICDAIIEVEL